VGKKELEQGAPAAILLSKLLKEDLKWGERRKKEPLELARQRISGGESFLISVTPQGKPKAYLSVGWPKTKQDWVSIVRSFTSSNFRSHDRKDRRWRGVGGEQRRLLFRLIAIARKEGIREIYVDALDKRLAGMYRKHARKPRLDLGSYGLRGVSRRLAAWRQIPAEEHRLALVPETIYVTTPKSHHEHPKAIITVRQRRPAQLRRARH
jgi:hypothetical protein